MNRLCVFCGSSAGRDPAYARAARDLGTLLARRKIGLVYGGGRIGMMGAIADAALDAGAEVIGVMPRALVAREQAHRGLTELRLVDSMHERKAALAELADGFAALPGGIGTLEELFEVWTWAQLGVHQKPCGVLNAGGYFDSLLEFLDHGSVEGFIRAESRRMLVVEDRPEVLLERLLSYQPLPVRRWVDASST